MGEVKVFKVDIQDEDMGRELLRLLNAYALDHQGGGENLSDYCRQNLLNELKTRADSSHILIAAIDGINVGISTTFVGFSTFAARPLLNIHDFAVCPEHRRKGVGKAMMAYIEEFSRSMGYCKLTLEVRQSINHSINQSIHQSFNHSIGQLVVCFRSYPRSSPFYYLLLTAYLPHRY